MKLLFKQRAFSWLDSYDIYDEDGKTLYQVKGKLDWGHKLLIYDQKGNQVGMLKEEVFKWLATFNMYVNDNQIGTIKQELTFLKPKYSLDCSDWKVTGDVLGINYSVIDSKNNLIMSAEKKIWNWTDTYVIDVINSDNALKCLMIVLAIDAANCIVT